MSNELTITDYQRRVLEVPEDINLALLGGRGGGKSFTKGLLSLRYGEQYREKARMLFIRKSYAGLRDFEQTARDLYGMAYSAAARYNAADHVWRLPTRAYFELAQLESHADLNKFIGRSFGLLFVDEVGHYSSPALPDLLRANLRGPKGVPMRVVLGGNPGSAGQAWLAKRFVFGKEPWKAYKHDDGSWWMWCPSTLEDNPHIDRAKYRAQLTSACASDPELLKAWLDGSFTSQTGAYFSMVLDESRNAVGPFEPGTLPKTHGIPWPTWLAHDYGSAAPSCTFLMTKSPGGEFQGKYYARDSIIILDELAAFRREDMSRGLGWTAATTGEAIREWCTSWKVSPSGVADDACFAKTGHARTIAEEFAAVGVRFQPARKADRISGWTLMRRLLADAGSLDKPGLYVSRSCELFWATAPFLPRDQKRIEDVDSSANDHAADACRYGLLRQDFATRINLGFAH